MNSYLRSENALVPTSRECTLTDGQIIHSYRRADNELLPTFRERTLTDGQRIKLHQVRYGNGHDTKTKSHIWCQYLLLKSPADEQINELSWTRKQINEHALNFHNSVIKMRTSWVIACCDDIRCKSSIHRLEESSPLIAIDFILYEQDLIILNESMIGFCMLWMYLKLLPIASMGRLFRQNIIEEIGLNFGCRNFVYLKIRSFVYISDELIDAQQLITGTHLETLKIKTLI